MKIGDGYTAQNRADYAEESLVGAADKKVFNMCGPVLRLVLSAINRAVYMAGEPLDGLRREDIVKLYHVLFKTRNIFFNGVYGFYQNVVLGLSVFVTLERFPDIVISHIGHTEHIIRERFFIFEVIGTAKHSARIVNYIVRHSVIKFFGIIIKNYGVLMAKIGGRLIKEKYDLGK